MNSAAAKVPDCKTDWQAIDIFVFCNGQQYSPPRKYHLCANDLNLWNSTLHFLAKSQYGSLHSFINLYTIEGKKVSNPLELSNGAAYVAVGTTDSFKDSGYDKYLLKATRSYERRLAKKNENVDEPDKCKANTNVVVVDVGIQGPFIKSREESAALKTIVSSITEDHEASITFKPKPITTVRRISEALQASNAKSIEGRKISSQRPSIVKKCNQPTSTTPNLKPSFKKRDSIRSANVKIIRPEGDQNSSVPSSINHVNKLVVRRKVNGCTNKPRELSKQLTDPVQSHAYEYGEVNESSSVKVTNKNDGIVSTNSAVLHNVIEDKEIVLTSNVYQNPQKNNISISVNPNETQQIQLTEENIASVIHNENVETLSLKDEANQNIMSELKNISRKSSNETVKYIETPSKTYLVTAQTDNYDVANADKENSKINSAIKVIAIKSSNDTIKVNDSLPRRHSVLAEKLSDEPYVTYNIVHAHVNDETKMIAIGNENDKTIESSFLKNLSKMTENIINIPDTSHDVSLHTAQENKKTKENPFTNPKQIETITYDNQPLPRYPIITEKITDDHLVTNTVSRTIEENTNIKSEIKTVAAEINENIQTHDFTSSLHTTATDKFIDEHYVAVLSKGDVVSLKFNIEIQNYDAKYNNNETNSVSNILHPEKGSQVNIQKQIVTPNHSLLSIITKEIQDHHIGNTNHVIIVQYSNCKYCTDHIDPIPEKSPKRSYIFLLPVERFEENADGCKCEHQQIQGSLINPLKATYSCMSLQRITKRSSIEHSVETESQNVSKPAFENVTTLNIKTSEKDILSESRKKSVVINEESRLNSRESSKISHEETVEAKLTAVTQESNHLTLTDNCTQTDWCDVLLEARLLEDGHYEFRLPPLELLKVYKFL